MLPRLSPYSFLGHVEWIMTMGRVLITRYLIQTSHLPYKVNISFPRFEIRALALTEVS